MTRTELADSKLVTICGPEGEFRIAFTGARKGGLEFLYKDNECRFYFYPQIELKPVWKVVVEATSGIRMPREREQIIRRNIELFFKTRNFLRPAELAVPSEAASIVNFTWGIAQ